MSHDDEDEHECGKRGQTFDKGELTAHAREEHDMDV